MAKRGGSRHYKRLTVPSTLPVEGRKRIQWLLSPNPGPHKKSHGVALGSLLRDQLQLAPGVRCLVTEGKHAGETATLEKIIERVGSMDSEAQLKSGKESFITVTKYLFVVDDEFA